MSRALRIAMVAACPFPFPRGTPTRILRMAESVAERGHEVHVVTYHLGQGEPSPLLKVHRIRELRAYHRTAPGPNYRKLVLADSLLALELRRLLRSKAFDIVHAHHYESLLVATLMVPRSGPPVIFDAVTLLETELPYYRLGLSRRVKRWLGRRLDNTLPRRASHIISVSDEIRDRLIAQAGIAPERITFVPSGVETRHFGRANTAETGASRPPGQQLIYTGNLASYQGIEFMLQALREVMKTRPRVRLLIVTHSDFRHYEPLASALGIRDHIDVVEASFGQLPSLLSGADVALNPRTECDGLPQKLLNYMAASKPIVSFAGSAKGIVNGKQGLIVENGNIPALAKAIIHLLDAPEEARQLGASARRFAMDAYSWQKTAARTEAVYTQLLERRRSPAVATRTAPLPHTLADDHEQ